MMKLLMQFTFSTAHQILELLGVILCIIKAIIEIVALNKKERRKERS